MAQTVEISLRIPSLRVQREEKTETISNSDVRFTKRVELDSIPKAGAVLADVDEREANPSSARS